MLFLLAKNYYKQLLAPLCCLILLLVPPPDGLSLLAWRTTAVAIMMAIWWVTEAVPLYVTSLLPLVLFPLLDIASINQTSSHYANPLIMLNLGGFLIAQAIQKWHIHRRISLYTLLLIGDRPQRILLGFMLVTSFFSMWVSNTATTLLMYPIALSILSLLEKNESSHHFATALLLAIAYSATLGGIGTLIGTPANAFLAAFVAQTYHIQISFLTWMLIGIPIVLISLPLLFLLLTRALFPFNKMHFPSSRELIQRELEQLGPMTLAEKKVIAIFLLTATLWIFRPLLQAYFGQLNDASIAIFSAILLFALPAGGTSHERLLDWDSAKQLPWGVLLLFGGGLSLATAINDSALAEYLGGIFQLIANWPSFWIVLVMCVAMLVVTEFTSNIASISALLPIIGSYALSIGQGPIYFLIPVTLAASCAFMLPVATPPNAIIFGSNHIRIQQMITAGAWLNVIMLLVILLLSNTLLPFIYRS